MLAVRGRPTAFLRRMMLCNFKSGGIILKFVNFLILFVWSLCTYDMTFIIPSTVKTKTKIQSYNEPFLIMQSYWIYAVFCCSEFGENCLISCRWGRLTKILRGKCSVYNDHRSRGGFSLKWEHWYRGYMSFSRLSSRLLVSLVLVLRIRQKMWFDIMKHTTFSWQTTRKISPLFYKRQ